MSKRKSASAFRTIGEVASELGISPHVLRFWESKFTQIKPHKRRGGHRYYRPSDVETIKEIKSLLYDRGYTIKGAQKHLKEQKKTGAADVQSNLFDLEPAAEIKTPANSNDVPASTRDVLNELVDELTEIRNLLRAAE